MNLKKYSIEEWKSLGLMDGVDRTKQEQLSLLYSNLLDYTTSNYFDTLLEHIHIKSWWNSHKLNDKSFNNDIASAIMFITLHNFFSKSEGVTFNEFILKVRESNFIDIMTLSTCKEDIPDKILIDNAVNYIIYKKYTK